MVGPVNSVEIQTVKYNWIIQPVGQVDLSAGRSRLSVILKRYFEPHNRFGTVILRAGGQNRTLSKSNTPTLTFTGEVLPFHRRIRTPM